jgi:microcystin degradation protein MlrC
VRRVRELVGPKVPIGLALDQHGNISQQMVENADITTVYQTTPQIDAYQQAVLGAKLTLRVVRGEIRPTKALVTPPLLVNIPQPGDVGPADVGPAGGGGTRAGAAGVLTLSVVEGYPYADVAEMGMSFIAITDSDGQPLADAIAARLSQAAWSLRDALNQGGRRSTRRCGRRTRRPRGRWCCSMSATMSGAEFPGTSTFILHAARRLGVRGVLQAIADADGLKACQAAARGRDGSPWRWGKTDGCTGTPFAVEATVTALSDGEIRGCTGRRMPGFPVCRRPGPSAADVRTDDGFTLVLISRPGGTTRAPQQFRTLGAGADGDAGVDRQGRAFAAAARGGADRPADDLGGDAGGDDGGHLTTFAYQQRRAADLSAGEVRAVSAAGGGVRP